MQHHISIDDLSLLGATYKIGKYAPATLNHGTTKSFLDKVRGDVSRKSLSDYAQGCALSPIEFYEIRDDGLYHYIHTAKKLGFTEENLPAHIYLSSIKGSRDLVTFVLDSDRYEDMDLRAVLAESQNDAMVVCKTRTEALEMVTKEYPACYDAELFDEYKTYVCDAKTTWGGEPYNSESIKAFVFDPSVLPDGSIKSTIKIAYLEGV